LQISEQVRERKISVLIVEHNALLRDGLSLLIQGQPDLELAGTTGSCVEAVELFIQHRPDVTLLDLDLPDSAGITTLRRILKKDPATCVLGLVTYEEDVARERALRAGARSCITKDRLNQDLLALIWECARR
jgi:DNA-binding NarL/FixJ family response regulator